MTTMTDTTAATSPEPNTVRVPHLAAFAALYAAFDTEDADGEKSQSIRISDHITATPDEDAPLAA